MTSWCVASDLCRGKATRAIRSDVNVFGSDRETRRAIKKKANDRTSEESGRDIDKLDEKGGGA